MAALGENKECFVGALQCTLGQIWNGKWNIAVTKQGTIYSIRAAVSFKKPEAFGPNAKITSQAILGVMPSLSC